MKRRIVTRMVVYDGRENWVESTLGRSLKDATDTEASYTTMFGTVRVRTISDRTVGEEPKETPQS